jgi:hypothetical protein
MFVYFNLEGGGPCHLAVSWILAERGVKPVGLSFRI